MIKWLLDWWHARQRAIDIKVLWPACKEHVRSIEDAREVFMVHALHDSAWFPLGVIDIEEEINKLS